MTYDQSTSFKEMCECHHDSCENPEITCNNIFPSFPLSIKKNLKKIGRRAGECVSRNPFSGPETIKDA